MGDVLQQNHLRIQMKFPLKCDPSNATFFTVLLMWDLSEIFEGLCGSECWSWSVIGIKHLRNMPYFLNAGDFRIYLTGMSRVTPKHWYMLILNATIMCYPYMSPLISYISLTGVIFIRWSNIYHIVSGGTHFVYIYIYHFGDFSPFGNQNKCTCIITHSQNHTLDNNAKQKTEKHRTVNAFSVGSDWYCRISFMHIRVSLCQVSSFGHQGKCTCMMAHFLHYALDHPASQYTKSDIILSDERAWNL